MGYPAAGKTTAVRAFVDEGYERLNRDEAGGRLVGLTVTLDRALRAGTKRFVLDNTYPSRRSRAAVIDVASRHGAAVRCVWLDTSLEDAQVNACERLIARYGSLPMPEALATLSREDPNAFPPQAQFRYRRDLEPPDPSEGLSAIERRRFERRHDHECTRRGLIVDLDGILWQSRRGARSPLAPDDVDVVPGRAAVLRRYRDEGWLLLGTTWQPAIAEGVLSVATVEACIARARELLGVEIEVVFCPHGAGPPVCWCRKPLPGLGVALALRHHLDRARSVHVGRGPHDRGFAERIGFTYLDHAEVFDGEGSNHPKIGR
jgi:histidinol phosphatase-like enzyme